MKILLDTNFILTCVKQKIGFSNLANEIIDKKIEWLVPQDILNELETLKNRTKIKIQDKNAAKLSLEILQTLNSKIIQLPDKNPNIDIKIANYIANKNIVLATLDKNLKSRVNNKILTIRGKNTLKLI